MTFRWTLNSESSQIFHFREASQIAANMKIKMHIYEISFETNELSTKYRMIGVSPKYGRGYHINNYRLPCKNLQPILLDIPKRDHFTHIITIISFRLLIAIYHNFSLLTIIAFTCLSNYSHVMSWKAVKRYAGLVHNLFCLF